MTMIYNTALFLLIGLASPAIAQVEPLRFVASNSWTMPYADIQADKIQGGIVFDMAHAIGESLKVPVAFVVLPRNRIDSAAIAGIVDVRCYSNPAWTKVPDLHLWTKPLFDAPDVIVGRTTSTPITTVDQIPAGTAIGTVLGFVYPTLEDHLTNGHLLRDNAADGEKNLLKLTLGRYPYAVTNSLVVDWYLKQGASAGIAKWRIPLNKEVFHCGVLKTSRTDSQRVISAIEGLKSSDRLEKILGKFR